MFLCNVSLISNLWELKKYHDIKTNYPDTHTLEFKICIPDVQGVRVIQIHFPFARQRGFLQGAARSCITCLVLIFILHQLLLSLQELLTFWLPMLLLRPRMCNHLTECMLIAHCQKESPCFCICSHTCGGKYSHFRGAGEQCVTQSLPQMEARCEAAHQSEYGRLSFKVLASFVFETLKDSIYCVSVAFPL